MITQPRYGLKAKVQRLAEPAESAMSESSLPAMPFRALWRQVLESLQATDGTRPLRIGVTACHSRAGVSTVATQLAWAATLTGPDEALLIDCNAGSPQNTPGFADLVVSGGELEQVVQPTPIRRLWSLSAGSPHLHPQLYDHPGLLGETLDRLAQGYQPLVCDLPPLDSAHLNESSGVLELVCQLDGVLLVVEAGRTPQDAIALAQRSLARHHARLLGVVMNKQRFSV